MKFQSFLFGQGDFLKQGVNLGLIIIFARSRIRYRPLPSNISDFDHEFLDVPVKFAYCLSHKHVDKFLKPT